MGQYKEPEKEIKSAGVKQTGKMTSDIENITNKSKPRRVKGGLKIRAADLVNKLRSK